MSKSKNKTTKSSLSDDSGTRTDASVFITVFKYCLLIILLPVISFFATKRLLDSLEFTSLNANIYSAVSAVVCLHIALGLYLFKAYSEGEKPRAPHQAKQD